MLRTTVLTAVLCCGLLPQPDFFKRCFQNRGQRKRLSEFARRRAAVQSAVRFQRRGAARQVVQLPTTMVPRAGLKMGDLSAPQRKAAMSLLPSV